MRPRLVAVVTVGVAMLAAVSTASATVGGGGSVPADSLRALGAQVGLRVGSAIIPFDLDNAPYRQIAGDQFSTVTPGNEMKWQLVEPTRGSYDWSGGDRLVQFARQHRQLVRGHTLMWHNQLPTWLTQGVADGSISNEQLRALLRKHITDEVTHFRGQIWQWDVANEFFTDSNPSTINPNNFWVSHLGTGVLADAFRWARAADPQALLFYNDYNIAGEDGSNAESDGVYAWVKQMRAQGVPVDGIGDQGHLDLQYGFPVKMRQDLQRYANLGLKVAITEADVRTFVDDPVSQVPTNSLAPSAHAFYYDQMLKACLAVRSCLSFTVWGFGDADSWVPGFFTGEGYAGTYDVNLQPKPAFFTMQQDLVLAGRGAPHRQDDSR
ncbi:endo-1,4-beta-xylanase [Actinocrispum sp. NPDC049592]|uniref:endo-1,4-beta-xylanase n=1 Tax=Actinocrispum sp. NPDC049592 TaxID=3154835 RepID=UPI003442AEC6